MERSDTARSRRPGVRPGAVLALLLVAVCPAVTLAEPPRKLNPAGDKIPLPVPVSNGLPARGGAGIGADLEALLAIGWDSNPAQAHDGPSLAFARWAFSATGPLGPAESGLGWGADAWYRDYEGANDSWQLALRGAGVKTLAGGLAELRLAVEAAAYRDRLVAADARNEIALRLGWDRILSARASVNLSAALLRQRYLDPSLPWAGRPGSGAPDGGDSGSGAPVRKRTGAEARDAGRQATTRDPGRARRQASIAATRDDWLATLGLAATWHWSPARSGTLGLRGERCNSSVAIESYRSLGADLSLLAEPLPSWRLELGLGWYGTDYDRAPQGLERRDRGIHVALSVRRLLPETGPAGAAELYCELGWLENASNIEAKAFRQTVTQCGLAWRF